MRPATQHPWRRRLKLLAALVTLAGVTLLLFRLLLYPHTFAGKFDRLHLGMSEAEAIEILGPPATPPSPWTAHGFPRAVTRTVRHVRADGQEKMETLKGEDANGLAVDLHFGNMFGAYITDSAHSVRARSSLRKWSSPDALIFLELDEEQRVVMKTWVEMESSRTVWRRLRSWLGLA